MTDYICEYDGVWNTGILNITAENVEAARQIAIEKIIQHSGMTDRRSGEVVGRYTPEHAAKRIISISEGTFTQVIFCTR